MEDSIIIERDFCFICSAEHYPVPCLNCGFRHCWKCRQTQGVTYSETPFSVGDGRYYCNTCDQLLRQESASNKLHEAFVAVRSLRDELINWQVRSDAAQKQVQQLLMAATGIETTRYSADGSRGVSYSPPPVLTV